MATPTLGTLGGRAGGAHSQSGRVWTGRGCGRRTGSYGLESALRKWEKVSVTAPSPGLPGH